MKKSEMQKALRDELELHRRLLRNYIQEGEKEFARMQANRIAGVASLAERLGLLDAQQAEDIQKEASDAAIYGFRVDAGDEPA